MKNCVADGWTGGGGLRTGSRSSRNRNAIGRDLLLDAMAAYALRAPQSQVEPVSSLEALYRNVTGDWLTDWQAIEAGEKPAEEASAEAPPSDEVPLSDEVHLSDEVPRSDEELRSDEVPTDERRWPDGTAALGRHDETPPAPRAAPPVLRHVPPVRRMVPAMPPPSSVAAPRPDTPSDAPVAIPLDEAASAEASAPGTGLAQRMLAIGVAVTALVGTGVAVAVLALAYQPPSTVPGGELGRVGASLAAATAAEPLAPTVRIGTTTIVRAFSKVAPPFAPGVVSRTPIRSGGEGRVASAGSESSGLPSPGTQPIASAPSTVEATTPLGLLDQGNAADPEPSAPAPAAPPFDQAEARRSLAVAALAADKRCAGWSAPQTAPVAVTFAPSGRVTTALVTGGPLLGTAAASCVAQALHGAVVSPFEGEHVTVRQTIDLP